MTQKAIRTRSRPAAHCGLKLRALGSAAFLSLSASPFTRAQASPTEEYQLKAAFRRLRFGFVVFASALAMLPLFLLAQTVPTEEYEVKAAFLISFANFVYWPEDPHASRGKEIRLCVLGDDPFGSKLDRLASGKSIGDRPIALERVEQTVDARLCHVLFLSPSLRSQTKALLENLRGTSILTVGETPDFTRQGGMIRMMLIENRVRFEINVDAAERARLSISAKLLALSQVVHDERKKGAD